MTRPKIAIIGTGGTIASKYNKRKSFSVPAMSVEEIIELAPRIESLARIETNELFIEPSENLNSKHWKLIIDAVKRSLKEGAEGIVITHGSDSIVYTAAALAFAIKKSPTPIVLVQAMSGPYNKKTDAIENLIGATLAASRTKIGEVAIASHSAEPNVIEIHRGTRTRKCDTARLDAFRSINTTPIARINVSSGRVKITNTNFSKCDPGAKPVVKNNFASDAALLKYYCGMDSTLIDSLIEKKFRGIIFETLGLGHVGSECHDALRSAIRSGIFVGVVSQCIWGNIDMTVYSSGQRLLSLGLVSLKNMLAETALVKLMWGLAECNKDRYALASFMQRNVAREISLP